MQKCLPTIFHPGRRNAFLMFEERSEAEPRTISKQTKSSHEKLSARTGAIPRRYAEPSLLKLPPLLALSSSWPSVAP